MVTGEVLPLLLDPGANAAGLNVSLDAEGIVSSLDLGCASVDLGSDGGLVWDSVRSSVVDGAVVHLGVLIGVAGASAAIPLSPTY